MLTPRRIATVFLLFLTLPGLAAGRELAPRGGGPTSYHARGPEVAFAAGRFLTVWTEDRGAIGTYLYGSFSTREGQRITDLAFPILPLPGHPAQLVSRGDAFTLFWVGSGNQTFVTDIDADGRFVRTRPSDLGPFVTMRAAWNGTHFLVALRRPTGLALHNAEALLLDASGKVVLRNVGLRDIAFAFEVIPHADGFTVISTSHAGVDAYRITNAGALTETVLDPGVNAWLPAATATPDGALLVVWSVTIGNRTELRSVILGGDGTLRERRLLRTVDTTAVRARALARNGETYTLVYDILRPDHTMSLETLLFDAASSHVATTITSTSDPDAATDGSAIYVAYLPVPVLPIRVDAFGVPADGVVRSVETLSRARTRQTQPALATGGGRYLAAFNDITGSAAFVRGVSLGLDAEPLSDHTAPAGAHLASRELAWSGTEYLAVELRNDRLVAVRLTHDGVAIDTEPLVLGDAERRDVMSLGASVTWAGDRWVVTWVTYESLRFVTVSRGGVVSAVRNVVVNSPLPGADWDRGFVAATAAWNGSDLLLAWTEEQRPACGFFPPCGGGDNRTFAARITVTGELRDAALAVTPASTLSLATGGEEFFLLGGTTATVIDASAAPRVLATRDLFDWLALGDVTWDGNSYAVALRYRGARWHLSVAHYDRNANPVGAARHAETLAPDQFLPPSIAAMLPSSAVIAVQEGDITDGVRATVYAEQNMAPLPAAPPPPANVRIVGNEVRWEAPVGAEVELYRIEALTEFGWQLVADVAADQPRRFTTQHRNVRVTAFNAGGPSEPASLATSPKRRAARR